MSVITIALASSCLEVRAAWCASRVDARIVVNGDVSGPDLVAARGVATELYAEADVQLVWQPQDSVGPPRQPTVVVLSSSRGFESALRNVRTLGLVVQPGVRAYVLYDRVFALASNAHLNVGNLLGQVIAHELGHLLMGKRHSADGVMAATVNPRRLAPLAFTPEEVRALHAALSPPSSSPIADEPKIASNRR